MVPVPRKPHNDRETGGRAYKVAIGASGDEDRGARLEGERGGGRAAGARHIRYGWRAAGAHCLANRIYPNLRSLD
jgi:hypothetical protein